MIDPYIGIKCVCPGCGNVMVLDVKHSQYVDWQSGTLIQHAFPDLDADDRELLITGLCKDCWSELDYE